MAEIFYRTYPKKLNKDKSDLGFVDIYDLDKRFMLAKILGIDCLIIEDIFKKDMNNFLIIRKLIKIWVKLEIL